MRFDVITLKLNDSQISTTVFEVWGMPQIQTFWLIGWENPEKKLLNLLLFYSTFFIIMMMKNVMSICWIGGDCFEYSVATIQNIVHLIERGRCLFPWHQCSSFRWPSPLSVTTSFWPCNTRRWWWCSSCVAEGGRCLFPCHLWSSFVWPQPPSEMRSFLNKPQHMTVTMITIQPSCILHRREIYYFITMMTCKELNCNEN